MLFTGTAGWSEDVRMAVPARRTVDKLDNVAYDAHDEETDTDSL